MTIIYQGKAVETTAPDVAAFLAAQGLAVAEALVEYRGEIHAPGANLAALPLVPQAELNVFHVVAGG